MFQHDEQPEHGDVAPEEGVCVPDEGHGGTARHAGARLSGVRAPPTDDGSAGSMLVDTLHANTLWTCHQRPVVEAGHITGFNRFNLSIISYRIARDNIVTVDTDMRVS